MSETIVVDHLTKVYGPRPLRALPLLREGLTNREIARRCGLKVAVRRASFTVEVGEIFVVMGLSGSGKSTLVRMLNGLIAATDGEVSVAGHAVTRLRPAELVPFRRATTAMVFQSFALFPQRTALENAAFALEVAGVPRAERLRRAHEALARVGLAEEAGRRPRELSGGMQQRVGLARALAADPPVLLMDEAFSALDPLIRRDMQDQLLRLQRERRRTIVFISHDLGEAVRLGDRIALMEDGEILQIGTPSQLLLHPADTRVRRFFRDVDPASVLTVGDLAEPAAVVVDPAAPLDPQEMERRLDRAPSAVGYLVDRQQRYHGLLSGSGHAAAGSESGEPTLRADTPVRQAIDLVARSPHPVPVLGERHRFLGVVSPRTVLRSLAS
jgi:glycine betaine/proline transport system ATP-binding protein